MTTAEQAEVVLAYRLDPVAFAKDILGESPWRKQRVMLRHLAEPGARVAVRAAHACGKTRAAAMAVLWWTATGGKAVTTAATWRQVKDQLWREVHRAHSRSRVPIGGRLTETKLDIDSDAFAVGVSAKDEVAFQGVHGERVLVIADEAPGIRPGIFNAIEGLRAGGDVRVLMMGNPWGTSGAFYEAFSAQRSRWRQVQISAFDCPNLWGLTPARLRQLPDAEVRKTVRPYLITRAFVREKLDEWGEDHPLWQSKILGEFPRDDDRALIPLALLEAARVREAEPSASDPWEAGIDVAEAGEDETVVYVRHGGAVLPPLVFRGDSRGPTIAALLDPARPWAGKLSSVKVDCIGVGAYFASALEDAGLPVIRVNVGSAPRDKERSFNLRAELYWGLRERFDQGMVAGLEDDLTIEQLSTVRHFYKGSGQRQIESKADARKRGVAKSPDRADALMLAFAQIDHGPLLAFA